MMIETALAYFVSLGMIGVGAGWIVLGMNSTLCFGIGIAAIAVGAASCLNELRYGAH